MRPDRLVGGAQLFEPASIPGAPLCLSCGNLTVSEATVAKWFKKVGNPVKQGETVVEVEPEKAVTPIESPVAGTLAEVVAPEGTVVKMGQPLGMITPSS